MQKNLVIQREAWHNDNLAYKCTWGIVKGTILINVLENYKNNYKE